MTVTTVVKCFCNLLSMFSMPAYVHSNRGTSFMSAELHNFLHNKGIGTSCTTPYNIKEMGNQWCIVEWSGKPLLLLSKQKDYRHWAGKTLSQHFILHSVTTMLFYKCNSTLEDVQLCGTVLSWYLHPGLAHDTRYCSSKAECLSS